MRTLLRCLLCLLLGYGIGSINPSFFIARRRGFDIRTKGSGNAGGSNALITMGAKVGVFGMIFDIFKAVFAIRTVTVFFGSHTMAPELAATACILGHIFPFYMNFRGGKGLACLGGMILAFNWRLFIVLIICAFLLALITNYLVTVPLTFSVLFPLMHGCMTGRWVGALILCAASVAIIMRHMENLQRIRNGTELRFNSLWRREEEMERVKQEMERQGMDMDRTERSGGKYLSAIMTLKLGRENGSHSAILSSVAELPCVYSIQEMIS